MEKFRYGNKKPTKIIYSDKEVDYRREVDSVILVEKHAVFATITNGTCEVPSTILENETLNLTLVPNEHYVLPSSITVENATFTYDSTTGAITISEPTGAVTITATCLGEPYSVTATITNGTATGGDTIRFGGTLELTIVPNQNYNLPESVSVTGAQYSYNAETGVVSLSEPTGNVTVTATCEIGAIILGVENEGIASGTLTRTDMAVGKSFSINSSTGLISSDFDSLFPYSGIVEKTDDLGNVFVFIPKHYTKYTYDPETHYMKTQISNVQLDGYILNPCFKNEAGQEIDGICVGKYDACKVTDGGTDYARSNTGQAPFTNVTHGNMRTACKANGTNYGMLDYWTWRMLQDLFKIEFATTNSQSIMRGNVSGSKQNSGQCDSITGAKSGWNLTNSCMVYRGIENLYGNVYQWCDGMTFSSHNIYVCYDPTAYSSGSTASPYQLVGYQINPNGSGNPSQRGFDSNHPIVWESVATNGSDYDTGGYWYDFATGGTSPCPYVGGDYSYGSNAGLWYVAADTASSADGAIGGRLILRNTL